MMYADLSLLVHFLWICFLIFDLPLAVYFRWSKVRILHAIGMLLALTMQLTDTICPLTHLEEYFRAQQSPHFTYRGSFLITWLERIVYPGWISLKAITILTALLVLATLLSFIFRPLGGQHRSN